MALVAVLSAPRHLHAQSSENRVQLSLDANLAAYDNLKLSSSGTTASSSDTTWGPGSSGLGFGFGYGLSENWLIGLRLLGSSTTSSLNTPGSTDTKFTSYSILPRVEYMFALQPVHPYFGATLGLRGTSSSGAGSNTSANDFVFGGVAGVRAFATSSFSIDPSITLLGATGKEDVGAQSFDRSGLTLLLGVAFSGWIDASSPAAPPRLVPAPPVPTSLAAAPTATKARTSEARPAINALGEPEATLETDDDGTMRVEIEVADRGKLRLVGRPVHESHELLLELIGTPTNTLGRCVDLAVLVDGNENSARSSPRPVPGMSNALQILVAPKLIESIAGVEHSASLVLCGADWEITPGARSVVRRFIEQFRETAQRYRR
ncbi:MAG TPA: outer membrane beta-barrel protein [Polyangiaceae bacterium]|nr:outer membrane beta-barrel protein [Polyangiaceae bacterium]